MSLNPGQKVIGETETVTYEAGEALSPGDVVGIDSGTLRAVNSGDTSPNAIGVVADRAGADSGTDYASGDEVAVHINGSCILVSVASGISAGDELGPSATDGQLGSGSDGFEALTDEGSAAGLSTNENIPAGHAGVKLP
jgi:hypothetical protein